ncbi:MAG: biotin transporter BioY [Pseudoclavibacter sp.]
MSIESISSTSRPVGRPAPRVLADLVAAAGSASGAAPGVALRNVALVLGGTLFLIAAGFIVIPLPFTPVPVSLATFAVLLTGASLGPARAAASAGLYLVLGALGAPIFADGASGVLFPSFGYIVGYVLAAVAVGALARRRADRHVASTVGASVLGTLLVYAAGVPWLAFSLGVDFGTALALGVVPFLIGDAIKILAVSALLPSAWKLLKR